MGPIERTVPAIGFAIKENFVCLDLTATIELICNHYALSAKPVAPKQKINELRHSGLRERTD